MDETLDIRQFEEDRPRQVTLYHHAPWYNDLLACQRCPCRAEAKRVVPGVGPLGSEFLLLGQNPGEEEDEAGLPFVGRGGQELDGWLKVLGLSRAKVLVTNLVKCHTTKNRMPRVGEINVCMGTWLRQEMQTFTNLKCILPLGVPATKAVLGETVAPGVMQVFWVDAKFEGRVLHVVPLAHPAFLLRAQHRRDEMYSRVLPQVRDYLVRQEPEAYERASLKA